MHVTEGSMWSGSQDLDSGLAVEMKCASFHSILLIGDGEDIEGEDEGEEEEEEKEEEGQDDAAVELHCRVEEQKESVDGLKDEVCGRIVEKGHAGLCKYV